MKAEVTNKLRIISGYVNKDDSLIRSLIAIEIISRSGLDLSENIRIIFSETWIYKILKAFIVYGPMYKAELGLRLFPNEKDRHYKLSRSNQILDAFNYLLDNGLINIVEDLGQKKIYYITPSYEIVIRALFYGDVIALLET